MQVVPHVTCSHPAIPARTGLERWAWLRTVERRTHYGAAQPDDVVENRAAPHAGHACQS